MKKRRNDTISRRRKGSISQQNVCYICKKRFSTDDDNKNIK